MPPPMPMPQSLPPLVMHSLRLAQGILLLTIGVITAFYLVAPAIRFVQIFEAIAGKVVGSTNPIINKTLAGIGGIGNGITSMAQFNHLLKELAKLFRNDPANPSSLKKNIRIEIKLLILLLAISTLFGSYLLSIIQMRETEDIIKYPPEFEKTIAAVNAGSSELPQVIFGLAEVYLIKELLRYIFNLPNKEDNDHANAIKAAAAPNDGLQEEDDPQADVVSIKSNKTHKSNRSNRSNTIAPENPDDDNESAISGSPLFNINDFPFPNKIITIPVTIIASALITTLCCCYADEYFRMLPQGVEPVLGNVLAGFSLIGVICILLLGHASISQMLKDSTNFQLTAFSAINSLVTGVLALGSSFWEFILGTEVARGNQALAMTLGPSAMAGRALINAPFIYEFLQDLYNLLSDLLGPIKTNLAKCCPIPVNNPYSSIP